MPRLQNSARSTRHAEALAGTLDELAVDLTNHLFPGALLVPSVVAFLVELDVRASPAPRTLKTRLLRRKPVIAPGFAAAPSAAILPAQLGARAGAAAGSIFPDSSNHKVLSISAAMIRLTAPNTTGAIVAAGPVSPRITIRSIEPASAVRPKLKPQ
jgi:hypothetical protein